MPVLLKAYSLLIIRVEQVISSCVCTRKWQHWKILEEGQRLLGTVGESKGKQQLEEVGGKHTKQKEKLGFGF